MSASKTSNRAGRKFFPDGLLRHTKALYKRSNAIQNKDQNDHTNDSRSLTPPRRINSHEKRTPTSTSLSSGSIEIPPIITHEELEPLTTATPRSPISEDSFVSYLEWTLKDKESKDLVVVTTAAVVDRKEIVKARWLLILAAALYGSSFSLVKIINESGMSVGLSSTLRFGMAALVTLPWLLTVHDQDSDINSPHEVTSSGMKSPNSRRKSRSRWQILTDPNTVEHKVIVGSIKVGLWDALGFIAQAIGLETTLASKSAFLCSLAVVMVPILDLTSGRAMATRQVIGALLAAAGVGFLELEHDPSATTPGLTTQAEIPANNLWQSFAQLTTSIQSGDIASLMQPVAFGVAFWKMEHLMHEFPNEASRATAAQLWAVFLASLVYLAVTSMWSFSDNDATLSNVIPPMDQLKTWLTDPILLGALFWTGIVTTAVTIYLETVALKTLSAAESTLIISTEPLWGAAFAVLLVGEHLGQNAMIGALLIVFGCIYSNLGILGIFHLVKSAGSRTTTPSLDTKGSLEQDK